MNIPYHPRSCPEEKEPATGEGLKRLYAGTADFQHRRVALALGGWAELYWLEGMVRTERVNDYLLRPLATVPLGQDAAQSILTGGVWTASVQKPKHLAEAAAALAEGSCAIEVEGVLLLASVPTEEKRGVESPEDEPSQKGAKDAFVEAIGTNTSLVRRRLHTWRLKVKSVTVGRESRTAVEVVWIDGLTNPALVRRAVRRVEQMDVDALLNTQTLTDALTDGERTLFPLALTTQRPDRFCTELMNGRVGVFCDGIPQGWLVPGTAALSMRSPQDGDDQWIAVRMLSAVRYLCVLVSLLLPAGYIAMASFHFGLMPASLAETISAARQNVPISPPLEVVLLLLAFDILQEAGQRVPQLNGQSVSIIGSLVVGQAAVDAKLLSPVVVVVVAAAGIAGFTLPDQSLANALRVLRLALAVAAGCFGVLGIILGLGWICCHMAGLETMGVPWLAPFAPDVPKTPNGMTRVPVRQTKLRELFLRPLDKRNQR